MRALVAVVVLAACGGSDSTGGVCTRDSDCSGSDVCAADQTCESPGSLRDARIEWTVGGQPASAADCASFPNLDLYFIPSDGDTAGAFGYAPVPCAEGLFTELKLPETYTDVQFLDDASQALLGEAAIDASNTAMVDLAP